MKYSVLVIYNTFEVMAGTNNFLSGRTQKKTLAIGHRL